MQVEQIKTDALIPYARNARTHSAEQVGQIAASIREFGFCNPVLIDADNGIIAGHGRVMAAQKLGLSECPCIRLGHLTESQKRAYIIADNKLALNSGWDEEMLRVELGDLNVSGFDLEITGFSCEEMDVLLSDDEPVKALGDEEAIPDEPVIPKSVPGDVWLCGKHRVMCGDSTSIDAVEKLMDGKKAALIHADPPYGMGKESDGVANDNLYREKLDFFQMKWWVTFRAFLDDNASAYIWGNAPDLWRLWYCGGLTDSERLTMRNEIVWDKGHGLGQSSDSHRMMPTVTERCLFFMLGEQGFNNNADNYWEGWEPIRAYLDGERIKAGWSKPDVEKILGSVNKTQHIFSKSHFNLITEVDYKKLQQAANGAAFKRDYDELKRDFYATRAYFDNTHDNMTDVWEFPRVTGEDRHGHPTPKPVSMMERVMKSSLPKGGLCVEPFGGSGSTMLGAEKSDRVCYTMELKPNYCDVIVKRWQDYTGLEAVNEASGKRFNEL